MSTLEILQWARELISDPERWSNSWFAEDVIGKIVEPDDERACRWCLLGAIWKVAATPDKVALALDELYRDLFATRTVRSNRSQDNHRMALELLDRSICRLMVQQRARSYFTTRACG